MNTGKGGEGRKGLSVERVDLTFADAVELLDVRLQCETRVTERLSRSGRGEERQSSTKAGRTGRQRQTQTAHDGGASFVPHRRQVLGDVFVVLPVEEDAHDLLRSCEGAVGNGRWSKGGEITPRATHTHTHIHR